MSKSKRMAMTAVLMFCVWWWQEEGRTVVWLDRDEGTPSAKEYAFMVDQLSPLSAAGVVWGECRSNGVAGVEGVIFGGTQEVVREKWQARIEKMVNARLGKRVIAGWEEEKERQLRLIEMGKTMRRGGRVPRRCRGGVVDGEGCGEADPGHGGPGLREG